MLRRRGFRFRLRPLTVWFDSELFHQPRGRACCADRSFRSIKDLSDRLALITLQGVFVVSTIASKTPTENGYSLLECEESNAPLVLHLGTFWLTSGYLLSLQFSLLHSSRLSI